MAADAGGGDVAAARGIGETGLQPRDLGLRQAGQPVLQEVMVVGEVQVLPLDREARLRVAGLSDPGDPRVGQVGASERREIERTRVVPPVAQSVWSGEV